MRHLRTVVFVSLFASMGAGCAAIAGLGDLDEVSCDAGCENEAGDGTAGDVITTGDSIAPDSPGLHDSPNDVLGPDSTGDDASPPDTSTDSSMPDGMDGSTDGNDAADAPIDSPHDAAPDAEGGCGPLNSTSNCGACGVVCGGEHAATVGCTNSTSCNYTCSPGYSNCNQTGRNVNGCECATPTCCGSACETTHANGVGDNFYDCNALNTYSEQTANAACVAYVGQSNASDCMGGFFCVNGQDASVGDMVCSTGTGFVCNCWGYDSQIAGWVQLGTGAGTAGNNYGPCNCPSGTVLWH